MRRPAVVCLLLALASCEERGRTKNSGGGATLEEEHVASANVYRFVDVDRAVVDARKAVAEERWGDAVAASAALLKRQPGHIEGERIRDLAAFEAKNQIAFAEFKKGVESRTVSVIAGSYHQIGAGSRYLELARPDYERVREQWVVLRETDARNLARSGRCRDAHKVARSADELFPEMRPRLDVAAGGCRPATNQDEPEAEPPPSAPIASLQPTIAPAPAPAPAPEPAPAPAPPPPPVVVAAPPPAPAKPKMISPPELESYRVAGEKRPPLPAGARMIATRDRVKNIVVGLSLCVSATGVPTAVELVKPSEYNDANDKILADVKKWRFRPYLVGGQPAPVCTKMVFLYEME